MHVWRPWEATYLNIAVPLACAGLVPQDVVSTSDLSSWKGRFPPSQPVLFSLPALSCLSA